jgi:hypothetical protein
MVGGANMQAEAQSLQGKDNQNIFGGIGGSLFDIFKNMPKGLPNVGRGGGSPFPGANIPS